MGRSPCCDENGIKKGPWTTEEDEKLKKYIEIHGHGSWRALPKLAGLNRCGKSCRLRWTNYLRPDIKRGKFSEQEEQTILHWHSILGNKWSAIASYLPGRTDNEIKNYWNTHLKKKLIQMGFDPMTHKPRTDLFSSLPQLIALANLKELISQQQYHNPLNDHAMRLQTEALQLAKLQYLHQLLQPTTTATAQATTIGQYCQGLAGESAAQAAALNMLCTALSPRENLEVLCSQPPPLHQQHLNQSPMLSQLSPDPQQVQVQVQEPLSFGYVPTTPLSSQLTQSFGNSLVSPLCQGGTNTNSTVNVQPGDDSYWGFQPEVPTAAPPATTETSISNHGGGSSTPTSCSGASPCAPDDWQDLFLGADQSLLLN